MQRACFGGLAETEVGSLAWSCLRGLVWALSFGDFAVFGVLFLSKWAQALSLQWWCELRQWSLLQVEVGLGSVALDGAPNTWWHLFWSESTCHEPAAHLELSKVKLKWLLFIKILLWILLAETMMCSATSLPIIIWLTWIHGHPQLLDSKLQNMIRISLLFFFTAIVIQNLVNSSPPRALFWISTTALGAAPDLFDNLWRTFLYFRLFDAFAKWFSVLDGDGRPGSRIRNDFRAISDRVLFVHWL